MSPDTPTNGRVTLRDYLEQRFDALDARLEIVLPDHEDRIRTLEKREPYRTAAEALTGVVAMVATYLGWRQ